MTFQTLLAIQERRVREQLARPYVGPVLLPGTPRPRATAAAVRAEVMRSLGGRVVVTAEPPSTFCACGAIKDYRGQRCAACANKRNAAMQREWRERQHDACVCGAVKSLKAERCVRCTRVLNAAKARSTRAMKRRRRMEAA